MPSRPASEWWRGATLYQVYPRSFADGNGDGIGDLAGLRAHLDHVASLGVDGLWISPFFPSPMRDFGYDVSDHCGVDPLFGTLADVDALLAQAHAVGLKVVIDQVWSHTAVEHPWFLASRESRDNAFADWYVWADARPDGSPPNNWQSWMGGPAWQWEPRRGQYFLHNFLPEMPDLNFHCAEVQEAILGVARFWLERGVDGFRLDTANYYFHDRALRDNPPQPPESRGDSPVTMQRHLHNVCQPENLAFLARVRALMDGYDGRMAVAEIGSADNLARMIEYTAGAARLHTAYSFLMLGDAHDPAYIAAQMAPWQQGEGARAWPSWAFSNHDATRVATRWGDPARARHWLALLASLRGTLFIYQGEELGLPQSEVALEDVRDPVGLRNWPRHKGRDGCRTPMPWQADAPAAGFSAGRPWLPADPAHRALAIDRQQHDPQSTLNFTRRLLALRRAHPALRTGRFETLRADAQALVVLRREDDDDGGGGGGDAVLAAFNATAAPVTTPWPAGWQASGEAVCSGDAALRDGLLHLGAGAALLQPLRPAQARP